LRSFSNEEDLPGNFFGRSESRFLERHPGAAFLGRARGVHRFNAEDENEVRQKLKNDPWTEHGILKLESVKRWEIFIDQRK